MLVGWSYITCVRRYHVSQSSCRHACIPLHGEKFPRLWDAYLASDNHRESYSNWSSRPQGQKEQSRNHWACSVCLSFTGVTCCLLLFGRQPGIDLRAITHMMFYNPPWQIDSTAGLFLLVSAHRHWPRDSSFWLNLECLYLYSVRIGIWLFCVQPLRLLRVRSYNEHTINIVMRKQDYICQKE